MQAKLQITARIAKPEFNYSPDGKPCFRFSVPSEIYDYKTRQSETQWVKCVVFGDRAEYCQRNLAKGSLVAISGPLKLTSYTSPKNGQTYNNLEVRVETIDFITDYGEKYVAQKNDPGSDIADRPFNPDAPFD